MPFPMFEPPSTEMDLNMTNQYLVGFIRNLNFLLSNIDSNNVNHLDAKSITTGTLLAALVTIKSVLSGGGGAYIQIDGNGMTINDGTKDVFKVDTKGEVTMTGATVQSAASGARVEVSGGLITIYDASGLKSITIDSSTSPPKILFYDTSGTVQGSLYFQSGTFSLAGNIGTTVSDLTKLTLGTGGVETDLLASVFNMVASVEINGTNINSMFGSQLTYDSTSKVLQLLSPNNTVLSSVTLA